MVAIADALGWETVLIDPRVNSAKPERFPAATIIEKDAMENLGGKPWFSLASAAVIMTHNINLDAAALRLISKMPPRYVALLGPVHRQEMVLAKAELSREELGFELAGPAGLDIGGSLPESIALAVVSECHAALWQRSGNSLSRILAGSGQ